MQASANIQYNHVVATLAPRKVLIVLLGAIGDVTRALPLAVRIKQAWPTSELVWAVEPTSAPLLEKHEAIDRAIVFERHRGFTAYISFLRELRRERFDVVLDLQRHLKSGFTSFSTRAETRVGFHPKNAKEGNWLFNNRYIPRVENFSAKIAHYQLFGDLLGIAPTEPLEFGLRPTAEESREAEEFLTSEAHGSNVSLPSPANRIAFILGSSWPSRFWPEKHYVELADELYRGFGIIALLLGARSEREIGASLAREVPHAVLNLVEKTTLRSLVPLFSRVRVAIGSDSGPMHIAAAVGIPVISLWGSTSPHRSAPYGSEHLVLQSPIGCSPCYRRICPGLGTLCMKLIPPRAALAAIAREVAKEEKAE